MSRHFPQSITVGRNITLPCTHGWSCSSILEKENFIRQHFVFVSSEQEVEERTRECCIWTVIVQSLVLVPSTTHSLSPFPVPSPFDCFIEHGTWTKVSMGFGISAPLDIIASLPSHFSSCREKSQKEKSFTSSGNAKRDLSGNKRMDGWLWMDGLHWSEGGWRIRKSVPVTLPLRWMTKYLP